MTPSRTGKLLDSPCKVFNGIFSWISEVDGSGVIAVHERNESGNEITDILE